MGNFLNNGPKILKLIVRVRKYHILINIQKQNDDLKAGFEEFVSEDIQKSNFILASIYFNRGTSCQKYFKNNVGKSIPQVLCPREIL